MKKTVLVLSVVLATQMFAKDEKKEIKYSLPQKHKSTNKYDPEVLKKACDRGDESSCMNLGALYKKGSKVKKDLNKAIEIFKKSCDRGYMFGCENLAFVYYGTKKESGYKKAAPLLKDVCDKNEAPACIALGYMHYMGLGGLKKDNNISKGYYKKACDMGIKLSCKYYGLVKKEEKEKKK